MSTWDAPSSPAVDRLIEFWRSHRTSMGPPAHLADIERVEAACGVAAPPDLRDYFLRANGTQTWPDFHAHTWRSIREFAPASGEPWGRDLVDAARTFVLCDYAISCWAYAIVLSRDYRAEAPIILLTDGARARPVAGSFAAFIDMAVADRLPPPP